MLTAIIRRIVLSIPTMIALTALLFFSLSALLGSPAAMMLGQDASAESIAAMNARYGFDRPLYVQYFDWITSAIRGDFGRSHATQQSVTSAVLPALAVTLELAVLSMVLAALTAVVSNTVPAGRRIVGPFVVGANLVAITVPNFMLGISLIFVFSVALGWLPTTGWMPWSAGALDHLKHLILPVLTLSAYYFGVFSIVYRAEYRDVEKRLFIQAARAKGISRSRVAFRHALPNAILPVITFIGLSMGQLTGGAVVTETVFSMPGVGRLLVGSIASHDFPVMLAIAMMIVVGVVLMNLLADIAYTIVNPQIRIG
ncbi:MAG: ABC transporter permease [Casimicrobiaceae bacterium]